MSLKKIQAFIDMGHKYGVGHFSRASSLIDAFLEEDWQADFYINSDLDINLPKKDKVSYKKQDWLEQAPLTFCDLLLIDSYNSTNQFIQKLKQTYPDTPAIIIEDFQKLEYPEEYLIHDVSFMSYNNKNSKNLILNSNEFFLLRREFWHQPQKVNGALEDILIIFGGSDIRELSLPIAQMILSEFPNLNQKIVLGSYVSENLKQELKSLQAKNPSVNIELFINPDAKRLSKLMQTCDIAISAVGQTCLEIIASGLPFISVEIVDNQEGINQSLEKLKLALVAGDYRDKNLIEKIKNLVQLVHSKSLRQEVSNQQQKIIDGKGAIRSRDFILQHFNL